MLVANVNSRYTCQVQQNRTRFGCARRASPRREVRRAVRTIRKQLIQNEVRNSRTRLSSFLEMNWAAQAERHAIDVTVTERPMGARNSLLNNGCGRWCRQSAAVHLRTYSCNHDRRSWSARSRIQGARHYSVQATRGSRVHVQRTTRPVQVLVTRRPLHR